MLKELHWRSLKQWWTDQRLVMLYKIVNNLTEVDLFNQTIPHTRHSTNTHANSFRIPWEEKKAYLEYSFWPRTLKQWNALLASQVRTASNPYISLRVEYVLWTLSNNNLYEFWPVPAHKPPIERECPRNVW